jgi:hypothetical protein
MWEWKMKTKLTRLFLLGLGSIAFGFLCTWGYTSLVLANASREGVYATAEEGMIAMLDRSYSTDRQIKIIQAGPNSFDGSSPFIWYVIAEVHASSRADGAALGRNGCDAPGSFFLQTRQGWVHVGEGAFPTYVGLWMKVFSMAGEGQSTPSTEWAAGQSSRFCQP